MLRGNGRHRVAGQGGHGALHLLGRPLDRRVVDAVNVQPMQRAVAKRVHVVVHDDERRAHVGRRRVLHVPVGRPALVPVVLPQNLHVAEPAVVAVARRRAAAAVDPHDIVKHGNRVVEARRGPWPPVRRLNLLPRVLVRPVDKHVLVRGRLRPVVAHATKNNHAAKAGMVDRRMVCTRTRPLAARLEKRPLVRRIAVGPQIVQQDDLGRRRVQAAKDEHVRIVNRHCRMPVPCLGLLCGERNAWKDRHGRMTSERTTGGKAGRVRVGGVPVTGVRLESRASTAPCRRQGHTCGLPRWHTICPSLRARRRERTRQCAAFQRLAR